MWFVVCLCCVIIITSWVVCVADVQSSLSFSSCRVSYSCQLFSFKQWPACSCPGQECCALRGSFSFGFGGFALCFLIWDGMLCLT